MKLEDLFEPVSNAILAEASLLLPATLGRSILPIIPEVTTPKDAEVLLLGVYDSSSETAVSPDDIRRELYTLFAPDNMPRIGDLGNIPKNMNAAEIDDCLHRLAKYCLKEKKSLVLISPARENATPYYKALQKNNNNIGVTLVDSTIPMYDVSAKKSGTGLFSHIIENPSTEPDFLNVVGIQTYLTNPADLDLSNRIFVEVIRLGQLRTDIKCTEPLLRDSNLVCLDLNAIRHADNPAGRSSGPNGLYAEEACTVARYAGYADKVSFFGIFGIFENRSDAVSTSLVAQLIWHFFDGFSKRKGEYPALQKAILQKFIVKVEKNDEDLVFYKSKQTDRWWMEIPPTPKYLQKHLIACSYDEYLDATKHDIPFRWLFHLKKNS
ncbi:MAG TPA: hypothetical protein VMV56_03790 [Williamwhitmania sp.]|nr:hypothetical protein [Williamwhitmania sp.]